MLALIGALALAATSGAPRLSPITPPKGSVQGLIFTEDYPKEALDRNEQGEVGFKLSLDATGAVSNCVIEKSSGSAALDARTCAILRERAKFEPARDRHGQGVPVTYASSIRWQIAEDLTPSEPWASIMVVELSPEQRPTSCRYEFEGAIVATRDHLPETCSVEQEHLVADFSPITKSAGPATRVTMETRFEIGNGSEAILPPGEVLLSRAILALRIDEGGKIQSCHVITQTGFEVGNPCSLKRAFKTRSGADGKAAAFDATMTVLEYGHVATPRRP